MNDDNTMPQSKATLVGFASVLMLVAAGSAIYGRSSAPSAPESQTGDVGGFESEGTLTEENRVDDSIDTLLENRVDDSIGTSIRSDVRRSESGPVKSGGKLDSSSNSVAEDASDIDTPLAIPDEFNASSSLQVEIGRFLNERRASGDSDPVPELVAWLNSRTEVSSAGADKDGVYVMIQYRDGSSERLAL